MMDPAVKTWPQVYARIGGLFYLAIIVVGGFSEIFGIEKLTVSGDAAATAHNIATSELLFRGSVALHQVSLVCAIIVALILYVLLRPVSNSLSLLAAFFNLVSIAIEGFATVSLFGASFFLADSPYLKAFDRNQLHSLAYLSIKLYNYGFATALVFFGCCLFLYGYLIYRSGYFPKTIGVLLMLASLIYLTNSFALSVAPAFADKTFPLLVLCFIAETSLSLWLIVKGVNLPKWEEKARAPARV